MTSPIDFHFDYTSPYSYLASTRIEALAARAGARVAWRPTFLGAIHKATGNRPPMELPARAVHLVSDLHRWAALYGVPMRINSRFPFMPLAALRATCRFLEEEPGRAVAFVHRVYRAAWAEDRDVTDPAALAPLAAEVGLDPGAIAAAGQDPAWKDAVRANTDAAVAAGAYGLPVMLYEGELYFGNDRLVLLEERIARGQPWPDP